MPNAERYQLMAADPYHPLLQVSGITLILNQSWILIVIVVLTSAPLAGSRLPPLAHTVLHNSFSDPGLALSGAL